MYLKRFSRHDLFFGVVLFAVICFMVNFGLLEYASSGNGEQIEENNKKYREAVQGRNSFTFDKSVPVIYAITPTHSRSAQKADLTRLSQTFLHLTNLHWIVIEDSSSKTKLVANFLSQCGLSYTHLNILSKQNKKLLTKGVSQRNMGLSWLRKNLDPENHPGVVYFADDDNTYDLKIFAQMRKTKQVSVWPVGLVGGLRFESPIVKNGKVTGWSVNWKPNRPFPLDMAGFAVNLKLFFRHPELKFSNNTQRGFLESTFVSDLKVSLGDLEPLADNCTKVLVWHTRTEAPNLRGERQKNRKHGHESDPNVEV